MTELIAVTGDANPKILKTTSSMIPLCAVNPLAQAAQFKLLLLGDGNVGKTCFVAGLGKLQQRRQCHNGPRGNHRSTKVKRHLTGEFVKKYRPTEAMKLYKCHKHVELDLSWYFLGRRSKHLQGCEMKKLRISTSKFGCKDF